MSLICVHMAVDVPVFCLVCPLYTHSLTSVDFVDLHCQPWPEDALELVAHKFFDDVEMSQDVRDHTVTICKLFHQSVRALSDRYTQTDDISSKSSDVMNVAGGGHVVSSIFLTLPLLSCFREASVDTYLAASVNTLRLSCYIA